MIVADLSSIPKVRILVRPERIVWKGYAGDELNIHDEQFPLKGGDQWRELERAGRWRSRRR